MSINNLGQSSVDRTSLDDWESMLSLVCWYATLGTISGQRRTDDEMGSFPIGKWRTGNSNSICSAKQNDFYDSTTFYNNIVKHFKEDEDYKLLERLATTIHKRLFANSHYGRSVCGTFPHNPIDEDDWDNDDIFDDDSDMVMSGSSNEASNTRPVPIDPFEERAKIWQDISGDLYECVKPFLKRSMELQQKSRDQSE
ncbi:hypothetical protein IWW38_005194 [Coemansia aciculifera]|uniref:Uncharacterized protein n=1 Tax=Coemansia aciculifera TaxID=417176 RepID=A0ACC1LWI9_9FUNG|nr:hypothetical protein IWW38_005194 [Coemansia aciculifera]